jgi:hypothetical protein
MCMPRKLGMCPWDSTFTFEGKEWAVLPQEQQDMIDGDDPFVHVQRLEDAYIQYLPLSIEVISHFLTPGA